jgi:hypothetical protein
MKKIITICTAILITASVFAQAPNKMSYQAVIRNNSNVLVTNQTVGMQISILQSSANGTSVYTETQTSNTNANGLTSIEIGGGTVVSGSFSTIDWANGPYFIKTETDPAGGTNYTITGTTQLLSVPYAQFAKTSGGIAEYAIFEEQYPSTNIPLLNSSDPSWIPNIHPFNTVIGQSGSSIVLNSFSGSITLNPGKYRIEISSPLRGSSFQGTYLAFAGTLSNVIYSNLYEFGSGAGSYLNLDGFLQLNTAETFTLNQFLKHGGSGANTVSTTSPLPNSTNTTVARIYIQKL